MNKYIFKIFFVCLFSFLATNAFADIDYAPDNVDYYSQGMKAIKNEEYSKAIDSLKKALQKEPHNSSIWNNLAVAYTARGTYFYNQGADLEKAANDFRNALYYLEFYNKAGNTDTINQNINLANQNLNSALEVQKFNMAPQSRLAKAKELRGKGEFQAAIIEYIAASKERKYAYDSYVAVGDIMKSLSNEYNAAMYYDKALSINSNDPYLHLKYGRCLYKLGSIDTAVRELDIASNNDKSKADALAVLEEIWKEKIKDKPTDPVAQMNLGTVYQNKGEFELAMQQYNAAYALDPNNQMIKLNIATLSQQKGDYQSALDTYNEILKTRPNDIVVNTYKANTLKSMGKVDEAINVMKNLYEKNIYNKDLKTSLLTMINSTSDKTAENYLGQLATLHPNDVDIVYNYAYFLHKNKRYNEALEAYQKTISLDNKHLEAYLNSAAIYKQQNNTKMATDILNYAKTIYPNNDKINQMLSEYQEENDYMLMQKAEKLYNAKDYNDAIITYRSIKKPTEEVYLGIGACYQAMERYDEAINQYNKALAIDGSNPNTHYFLGLAYLYKKDYTKSEAALKKAIELDSINPDIADAYKSLKYAQSEEAMNKGIKLFESSKNEDAIINFNRAINLCQENGYAFYYRGLAYDTKGDNNRAIKDYQKAVSLNPELTMAYYSMGLSYDALNNAAEAKKMYQKFVKLNNADDEYTKYAKQRLTELK